MYCTYTYIYIYTYICMYNNNSVPCFCMTRESLSSPKKILIYLLMYSFIYFCVCDGHVVNNMYNMCVCIHYIDYIHVSNLHTCIYIKCI